MVTAVVVERRYVKAPRPILLHDRDLQILISSRSPMWLENASRILVGVRARGRSIPKIVGARACDARRPFSLTEMSAHPTPAHLLSIF